MMKISFYLLLFVLLGFTISCSKNDLSMSMDEHEIDDLENLNLLSNDPFEGFEKKCGPLLPYLDCTYSEDDNGQPKYNCEMRYNVEACYVVAVDEDRKSTRLNSSHVSISYAVFCLKKKKNKLFRYSI